MQKFVVVCFIFFFVGCTSISSKENPELNGRNPSSASVPFGLCTSGESSVALYKDRVEWKGIAEDSQLFMIFKQSTGVASVATIKNPAAPLYAFVTPAFLITYDYVSRFILCFGEKECDNRLLNRRSYSCVNDISGLR